MKRITITLTFFFAIGLSIGQEIPVLEPTIGFELDFSQESIDKFVSNEAFADCSEMFKKIEKEGRKGTNHYTNEEKKILFYCDETKDNIWQVEGGGCSWYCGGGDDSISATSYLKSQGINSYEPKNIHDLNYKTAWVEGVAGYGIGESITYHFRPESPRVTNLIVVNGYIKSKTAWENNSRVKQLKMYVNEKPFAILNLKDLRAEQTFSFEPIGNGERSDMEKLKKMPKWSFTFEILDVYKGKKYDDVVISEIYLNGIDVHCFARGTKIKMADNSLKNIEELIKGDLVLQYDLLTKELKPTKIEKLEKAIHKNLVTYKFESGKEITATQDHPFRIANKGWASLNPVKSKQYEGFENINKICIGDSFISINGANKLVNIGYLKDYKETYTISKLSSGDNFIANGFVVAVEVLKKDEKHLVTIYKANAAN